jgi:3-hydroxyisobutyrate dehydrogenase-like beta-hydroxyacid dehydrogenase
MSTIGFIGLGKMGGNMAARYLAAGYAVYGEDHNQGAAQWLIDQGLRWVDTPREVAQAAEVVMTSLPTTTWSSPSRHEPTVFSPA